MAYQHGRGIAVVDYSAKKRSSHLWTAVLLGSTCLLSVTRAVGPADAGALPGNGHYIAGKGEIGKAGASLTVKQSSTTGIIDWNSFSIGSKNAVTFNNGSGATLNRVTGGNLSIIAGSLHATGSLYLMNSQGVIVSGTGRVVTGGSFVASSSGSDAFQTDRLKLTRGRIVNRGTIVAGDGVTLAGRDVSDSGSIQSASASLQAANRLKIGGTITARNAGGSGGTIVATAAHIDVGGTAKLSASGTRGGTVLIGGDVHGGAIASDNFVKRDVSTAQTTAIAKGAQISADASKGAGGNIVIWSDGHTSFDGTISAKGQTAGGFAEVSSHNLLGFTGTASLTASHGKTGTLLLDPYDVVISNDTDTTETNNSGFFSPSGNTSILSVATLEAALATTDVQVVTGASTDPGSQQGNISVIAPITWSSANTLYLSAANSIIIGAPIKVTGVGALDISYGNTFSTINGLGSVTFSNLNSGLQINNSSYTLVNSISQLANDIAAQPTAQFALASSITAPTTAYTSSPIPTTFQGKLEGLGNSIAGLKIGASANGNIGLFAEIENGGAVNDLVLTDPSVTASGTSTTVGAVAGKNFGALSNVDVLGGSVSGGSETTSDIEIGGIVGDNLGTITASSASDTAKGGVNVDVGGVAGENNGTISHSSASGAVSGTTSTVAAGGLVGRNDGTVTSSYATGSATSTGEGRVGGLVGLNETGSTISDSYATGAAVGGETSDVGGLVGDNFGGTITNTYALGSATGAGSSNVGGLAGGNTSSGTITASYSVGKVGSTGTGDEIGGFIGDNENFSAGSIAGGYFDTDTPTAKGVGSGTSAPIGHGSEAGITGLTTVQMMDSADMPGLTFGSTPGTTGFVIFSLDGGYNNHGGAAGGTLPMLLDEATAASNIHVIANAHQLQLVGLDPNGTYFLDGNIDLSATSSGKDVWAAASGFAPIIGYDFNSFDGNLFGLGASIQNLFIDSDIEQVGLFYIQYEGLIEGLTLSNVNVTGTYALGFAEVGGLVGEADLGSYVRDVSVSGKVKGPSGSSDEVGGVFGTSDAVSYNLSSSATVSDSGAGSDVGGLIGGAGGDSSIGSSHATGSVSATGGGGASAGGLIGISGASIEDSYATGSVTGGDASYVGGLVGGSYNSILQSHATGAVKGGASSYIGGLVGDNTSSSGGLGDDYATGAVSGTTASDVGGLVGENDSLAVASFATGAVTGGASSNLGGFVGLNTSTIVEDYALGSVKPTGTGVVNAGGLAGENASAGQIGQAYAAGFVKGTVAAGSGGLVGVNDNTSTSAITAAYWDTQTTGQSAGIASGTAEAGVVGKTTSQLQSALPSDFDPADWKIVAGKSFPYLAWQVASGTPQVVSGTIGGETSDAGLGVHVRVNGTAVTALDAMSSGANGYYYELLAPGTISSAGSDVLAYLTVGSGHANAVYQNAKGSLSSFNLAANTLTVEGSATSETSLLAAMEKALGANTAFALYTSAGAFTAGTDLDLDLSASSFSINHAIDIGSGTLKFAAAGAISQDSADAITAKVLTGHAMGAAAFTSASNAITDLGSFSTDGAHSLALTDDHDLTVDGTVNTGSHDITLTTKGSSHDIAVDAKLEGATVKLASAATVTESSAGDIDATKLEGSSVSTAEMNSAKNTITDLGAFTTGSTFELTDDHDLTVDGTVDAGSHNIHLTTKGSGHDIAVDAKLEGSTADLVSAGNATESGTGAIVTSLLNVTAQTGIALTSNENKIKKLGTDKTTTGPNHVTL